jgi:hypothetical protein
VNDDDERRKESKKKEGKFHEKSGNWTFEDHRTVLIFYSFELFLFSAYDFYFIIFFFRTAAATSQKVSPSSPLLTV